ncbi:hypothetical protein EAG_10927 [Camponotus floridanus]|uniref:Uncharacterized protein n=1 Tax=Camponotus floridanus TaxID=104421 RepID=E2ALR1_CAMFO|nr:hypothetical protein EAG_10927 [Camponotus floridanus]
MNSSAGNIPGQMQVPMEDSPIAAASAAQSRGGERYVDRVPGHGVAQSQREPRFPLNPVPEKSDGGEKDREFYCCIVAVDVLRRRIPFLEM